MSGVADRIRQFIVRDLGWEGNVEELTDDLPLIDEHVLDSIGVLSLVSFLESEYGIDVADSEIVPARLGTLASIVRYVADKKTASIENNVLEDNRADR